MPEGMNVHVAHKLSEQERADRAKRRWQEVVEILEVLALAIAAVATAWSGYQAARGDGHQSVLYAESSRARFQADAAASCRRRWFAGSPPSTAAPSRHGCGRTRSPTPTRPPAPATCRDTAIPSSSRPRG
jgi:hypothetical protein